MVNSSKKELKLLDMTEGKENIDGDI